MRNKVLIYVSRLINDRSTPTGHLYVALVAEYQARYVSGTSEFPTTAGNNAVSDCHSIIHHLTELITTTTPVGTSSAQHTHVAVAVDGLVLGCVYDEVFEDLRRTAMGKDREMRNRICEFKTMHGGRFEELGISESAVHAYTMMCSSRTAVDKLEWAVRMMESVSDGFGDADSLLKAVVVHVVHIAPGDLFAQVLFCEEFIRDASASMGKLGYSLITLQAAAHFIADADCQKLESNLFEAKSND